MLVLSRNKRQGITFPGLDIKVEILDVVGSKVRLGVDAPIEVRVLRNELMGSKDGNGNGNDAPFSMQLPHRLRHELRNALHELSLNLHVYFKRLEKQGKEAGLSPLDPNELFQAIIKRLEHVGGRPVGPEPLLPTQLPPTSKATQGKALVVDDDQNERELLAGFLRMCDYEVDTVADGVEATNYLNQETAPRFILLDMLMPRCDGPTFLSEMRKSQEFDETHVFIVSGSLPSELSSPVHSGYTTWFRKPLDPRQIVDALTGIETKRNRPQSAESA